MSKSYKKNNNTKTDILSSFAKEINKGMTPSKLRDFFKANSFNLPELDTDKTPGGFYELVDRYISKNDSVLNLGSNHYSVAIEYSKKGKRGPMDFFFSMAQYLSDFKKDTNKVTSIEIYKTPCENSPKLIHFDQSEEARVIMCVKDKRSKSKINFKIGPENKKQVEFFEEDSFGVCVLQNMSQFTINTAKTKLNGMTLPNCYFVVIDFIPCNEIIHTTQCRFSNTDTRDITKVFSKLTDNVGKNFSIDKLTKTLETKLPGASNMINSLMNKEEKPVDKNVLIDENGEEIKLPLDNEKIENNFLADAKIDIDDDSEDDI